MSKTLDRGVYCDTFIPVAARKPFDLVMLPGDCHGAFSFGNFGKYFAKLGFRGIAISYQGQDGSAPLERKGSVNDYAKDVHDVLHNGLSDCSQIIFIVHSRGGEVVMEFIKEYPEYFSKTKGIVFLSSIIKNSSRLKADLELIREIITGMKGDKVFLPPSYMKKRFFSGQPCSEGIMDRMSAIPASLAFKIPKKIKPEDLGIPYLMIFGSEDRVLTLNQKNRNRIIVINGAPHSLMLSDRWEETAEVIFNAFSAFGVEPHVHAA